MGIILKAHKLTTLLGLKGVELRLGEEMDEAEQHS